MGEDFYAVIADTIIGSDSGESDPMYVALKILNKVATQEHESGKPSELQMLLRTCMGKEPDHRPQTLSYEEQGLDGPPHPGWYRVSGCLGAFTCDHSQHLIIVSPLYGEHMKDYMCGEPDRCLTPAIVKQIARHSLLALDYLHSQCGIIHSDVKPENILRDFNIGPRVDDIIEAILNIELNSGRDGRAAPLWLPHVGNAHDLHVVLTDLSHASWKDLILRSPRDVGSPALKVPELVLGFAFTKAIDIWAFGCTIFELLAGKPLFGFSDSRSPNELAQGPQYHLNLMQSLISEQLFPQVAKGTTTIEEGFIDSDGWIKSPSKCDTLDERIAKDLPNVGDRDMLAAFLRRCLRIDPRDRALASELIDDPWLSSG